MTTHLDPKTGKTKPPTWKDVLDDKRTAEPQMLAGRALVAGYDFFLCNDRIFHVLGLDGGSPTYESTDWTRSDLDPIEVNHVSARREIVERALKAVQAVHAARPGPWRVSSVTADQYAVAGHLIDGKGYVIAEFNPKIVTPRWLATRELTANAPTEVLFLASTLLELLDPIGELHDNAAVVVEGK